MVSMPQKPPLSVRMSEELVARVEQWAGDHGCKRNAAIIQLVELGLRGPVRAQVTLPDDKPSGGFLSKVPLLKGGRLMDPKR